MRIATKISVGSGVLIALMIALLMYHVSLIHRMETINRNLTEDNFQAATISLRLMQNLYQIEEFTRKLFVTPDPYASLLKKTQGAFVDDLQRIKSLDHSEKERAEIDRLSQVWQEYSAVAVEREALAVPRIGSPEVEESLPILLYQLDRLRTQTETVYQATLEAIRVQVETSTEAGQRAERIAWGAAAAALVLSVLVSLLIVRSISEPLRRLTEGTQAIAQGKFSYQLDASGTDEFAQLARDFNIMVQRLDELDKMKKEFVSHVSHELKAPLASTQETIQVLLEQIPGPLTEKQQRLLKLNLQSGRRLAAMIANLLDLSRMEAGVMDYEIKRQDLIALIRMAVAEFEARAREKDLHVETDLPPHPVIVECDGDRLIQVFGNLLDNAFKFSPDGAAIAVRVRLASEVPEPVPAAWRQPVSQAAHRTGLAVVAVSDVGPGIPEAHKEKIFEKFHQVRQGKKVSGQGVGLGLAICRTIMEAHHGAIWVEDNPEGGSRFFVLLPVMVAGESAESRASSPI